MHWALKKSSCTWFWVAQRFSAAIIGLLSPTALAAEVKLCAAEEIFSSLGCEWDRSAASPDQFRHTL
jgi:hypothetical protein